MLAQLTYRVPDVLGIDLGAIPGFIYTEQGQISALEINITMNLTFIVFTFGSMLVAIQIASAQLSPRIIATALLRNNVIRIVVGLFAYGLVISLGARNRTETIPDFVISIAALWGLVSVVAFLFLIDYAARLLRPLSIVRRMAEQGLKVFADVYPEAAGLRARPAAPAHGSAAGRAHGCALRQVGRHPRGQYQGAGCGGGALRRCRGNGATGRRLRRDRPAAAGRARRQRGGR